MNQAYYVVAPNAREVVMSSRPDFAVYSADEQLQLVVEVKGTPRSDARWAAKLRRNLLAHEAVPRAPYFLLVLPDQLYLWSNAFDRDNAPPDFHAETKHVLRRYLGNHGSSPIGAPLSEQGLELAVRSWLDELTDSDHWTGDQSHENRWLRQSGLAESVRTGTVRVEAAL